MAHPQPSDIVIAVVGVTGSGKSQFISHFTAEGDGPPLSNRLESVTREIKVYAGSTKSVPKFFLLDTPGFDNVETSDSEVLQDIASWLAAAYSRGVLLSGLIYVHQITAFRMSHSPMKNMSIWRKLCGESQLGAIVMATTYWTAENRARSLRVEYDLMTGDDFWGRPMAHGSKMFRQDEGKKSAEKIVEYLVQRKQKVVLDIQRQVVDDKMKLEDTAAGISIQENLADQISSCENELEDLREELDYAIAQKDTEWQGRIQKRITVLEKSSEHLRKRRV